MSLHLASLWKRGFRQVGNGVLPLPALYHDHNCFSHQPMFAGQQSTEKQRDIGLLKYGQGIKQIHNWHIAHKSYVKVLDYIKQAILLSRESFFFYFRRLLSREKKRKV